MIIFKIYVTLSEVMVSSSKNILMVALDLNVIRVRLPDYNTRLGSFVHAIRSLYVQLLTLWFLPFFREGPGEA